MSRRRSRGGGGPRRLSVAEDVAREIRAHLQERVEELITQGWDPEAARAEARRAFGDVETIALRCREISGGREKETERKMMLAGIWQDARFGIRTLLHSPGFLAVAVVTLALGIGANTAIFSVVNGVVLRPLPYEEPHQLVWISEQHQSGRTMRVAWPNYLDWHEQSTSFAGLAVLNSATTTVLGAEEPFRVSAALVGEDFWTIFPAVPLQGRLTMPADHVPGAESVIVVSRSLWENELGRRDLQEYSLELGGVHMRVVGVIPDEIGFPQGTRIWAPAEPAGGYSEYRTSHNHHVVGRLRAGVTLERAREEVDAITKRAVALARPGDDDPDFLAVGAVTVPLIDNVVGDVRRPLLLLLGAAGLVLLVACTNVASTLLARGTSRERELAVRASLGAGRGRLAGQLLTESLLLAALGGAAGIALAYAVVRGIRAAAPSFLPRLAEVGVDGTVLLYTAVAAVATALLFGLLPARRLTADVAGAALRSGSRGNAVDGRGRVWRLLVGTEVALALVLLVGSGLVVRSFQALLAQEHGFDAADVDVLSMSLSGIKYATAAEHGGFYDGFLERLESMPGVSAAGVMSSAPIQGGLPNGRLDLDGDFGKHVVAGYVVASTGAFDALDIPLLQGRLFGRRDGPDDAHVAVVSQRLAELAWPGESPIGKQINSGGMDGAREQEIFAEVVGVVGDLRHRSLEREPYPTVYFPYTQRPVRLQYGASVVVESATGEPSSLVPALRDALAAADPDVPVRIRTMAGVLSDAVSERRFVMLVLGGFSMTTLVLAAVGIFGVVSYSVARRTREMGIRLALGASPGGVRRMVVAGAMRTVLAGLGAGVVAALAMGRTMESLLYAVSPADPVAVTGAALLLALAALLASWLPARTGTRVDPMVTMRAE